MKKSKQSPIKQFYKQYKNLIIYGLIGINIFGMIVAVRIYINYRTIIGSIESITANTEFLLDQNHFATNFLSSYLQSDYSSYFLAHKNNRILGGEQLVSLLKIDKSLQKKSSENTIISSSQVDEKTPQEARQEFIIKRRKSNSF